MTAVIISMTTVPDRNGTLEPTISSLKNQSIIPSVIVAYLPPGAAQITNQLGPTVQNVRCGTDIGPIMKLTAVLDAKPDDIVVTVDDDIAYDHDWLATIVQAANKYPDDAIGFSGWNITDLVEGGDYAWPQQPCFADVIEGWSGAAYRAKFFTPEIFKVPPEFRNVDDVWISSWLHRRGIARRLIGFPMCRVVGKTPGLHDRSDFKELNRRAAQIGFQRGIT
jgi:hypothetical protein